MPSPQIYSHQKPAHQAPTISTAADLEVWLQTHTAKCERLGAMIEPRFCKGYRQDRIACHGCHQAEEMDRLAVELAAGQPKRQEEISEIEEATVSGKYKACLECGGTDRKIIGRGLCGSCYHLINKIPGQLDERYPLLGRSVAKGQDAEVQPAEKCHYEIEYDAIKPTIAEEECHGTGEGFACPDVQPGVCEVVPLAFLPSDAALLEFLQKWAKDERRSLDQQILAILDNAKAAAA